MSVDICINLTGLETMGVGSEAILRFINKIEPFRVLLLHANCDGSSGVVFFGVLGVL